MKTVFLIAGKTISLQPKSAHIKNCDYGSIGNYKQTTQRQAKDYV